MTAPPRLVVPDAPRETDRTAILAGLSVFNRAHADPGAAGPLAVLMQDDAGGTVGGLWGTTMFGWLQIEFVFVPEPWRNAGVGSAIMAHAEAAAAARGCIGAALDTFDFQARGFYEKLGYTLVGTIADCPRGGARHFLQKRLAVTP